MAMDVKKKLVELLNEVQETGVNEIPAGFGYTSEYVENEKVASHLMSNGVTVQEWISVNDRLPENKEHDWVLAQVVEDNGYMHIPKVMEYRQSKNDWFEETYGWLSEHNGAFTVTHWMPLPQPPKGE